MYFVTVIKLTVAKFSTNKNMSVKARDKGQNELSAI